MIAKLKESAEKVVGEDNVLPYIRTLGGEDFGFLSRKKPCGIFRLGIRKDASTGYALHTVRFNIDEQAMEHGVKLFVQFVLDNMNGIEF